MTIYIYILSACVWRGLSALICPGVYNAVKTVLTALRNRGQYTMVYLRVERNNQLLKTGNGR